MVIDPTGEFTIVSGQTPKPYGPSTTPKPQGMGYSGSSPGMGDGTTATRAVTGPLPLAQGGIAPAQKRPRYTSSLTYQQAFRFGLLPGQH